MPKQRPPSASATHGQGAGDEPPSGPSELILYTTPDQKTRIEVRLEDETVWLSQRQMAELFDKSVKTINEHIGTSTRKGSSIPAQLSGNPG